MKLIPNIIILITCVSICRSSINSKVKNNVISLLQRSIDNYNEGRDFDTEQKIQDNLDVKNAQKKARIMKHSKSTRKEETYEPERNQLFDDNSGRERYRIDPVLNFWARRNKPKNAPTGDTGEASTSVEMRDWKDEWKEHWIQKKFEAINSSVPEGDNVNMLAARPWGVPCGDPNQHDMPWGTCMLSMECEAEYRIYRGDYFCGRTQFVCCSLQVNSYDMYQGFDVSFADSELGTDSEEVRNREAGSKEMKRRKRQKEKQRRKRLRVKRKREIKKNIRKIVREIRKILSRSYRNGSTARKRKTNQLKKFIKSLKTQYKQDRLSVLSIHEQELEKVDQVLQNRLNQIKGMNQEFFKNETFRDIIVNGTVSPKVVRMLFETYPDLARMLDQTRRSGSPPRKPKPDYLDYDIEYGLLYY